MLMYNTVHNINPRPLRSLSSCSIWAVLRILRSFRARTGEWHRQEKRGRQIDRMCGSRQKNKHFSVELVHATISLAPPAQLSRQRCGGRMDGWMNRSIETGPVKMTEGLKQARLPM